jgi:hypothetical protein
MRISAVPATICFYVWLTIAFSSTVVVDGEGNFTCSSICTDSDVTNPDQVVTYDWNSRVPVDSSTVGETVQTFTCGEFDVRLTTFDETDCAKHQQGLQAAGCVCGTSSSSSVVAATMFAMVSGVVTAVVMMTSLMP